MEGHHKTEQKKKNAKKIQKKKNCFFQHPSGRAAGISGTVGNLASGVHVDRNIKDSIYWHTRSKIIQ